VLALLVPLAVESVFFFGTLGSQALEVAVGWATVLLTAVLLAIDAACLGTTDLRGQERAGPGRLFLGMLLLWIAFYPAVYFRRRHFGRPNFGVLALLVAVFFLGAPFLRAFLVEGVLPGGGPPSCTSPAVVQMVNDMIRKNAAGMQVRTIRGHQEVRYDRASRTRTGNCVVETATGPVTVSYRVTLMDARAGTYEVEILSGWAEDPPLCTSLEVMNMVQGIIKSGPMGAQVRSVDGYHEVRSDPQTRTRYGECTVQTNRGNIAVRFRVEWVDRNRQQFQVVVGD
jgi:hypothetical protein